MGFSRKEGLWGRLERDEWRRAVWKVMVAGSLDARSLIFVDEMGTNVFAFSRIRVVQVGTEGPRLGAPQSCGKNTTLLSSMTIEGDGAHSLAVGGRYRPPHSSRPTWSGSWGPHLARRPGGGDGQLICPQRGIHLGHEPGHTTEAGLELQKKTLGATERDELARGAFWEPVERRRSEAPYLRGQSPPPTWP